MADEVSWALPRVSGSEPPPGAPPRPWRLSGRMLVLDPADRVLLVRSRDPDGLPQTVARLQAGDVVDAGFAVWC